MAFDARKLRMALKDKNEHQTDDNYLIDVSDVFTRGILRGMGSYNRVQLPKQSYGLIYAKRTGIASFPLMSASIHIASAVPR